ncbi:hypothetical protein [Cellvibrio japonicus]|nr:hypothetical protein [Cellvibrio japonicus]QEI13884.1 hypothetical protein FY117_17780 [Cellvibrio japonicus]QEI17458.1 hypothetical protein FY116_17785 [Cellvibrio japonicus]QEI21034.1 hypothetical protein FY115_17780 [Cellvibrio japonicus]
MMKPIPRLSLHPWLALMLLLCSLPALAQIPAGAKLNKDKCLGYELEYKHYPRSLVMQVQGDLHQIYQQEADYQADAQRQGQPLNDGYLGPITWAWMQRFCKNFALADADQVADELPTRLQQIAAFAQAHADTNQRFISSDFALWVVANPSACELDTHLVLRTGSDAQLLALETCYRKPAAEPDIPAEPGAIHHAHTRYVLREDDYAVMADSSLQVALVKPLIGQSYPDRTSASAALADALKTLPPEQAQALSQNLLRHLESRLQYVLSDEVLNSLYQSGIGDELFAELQALPDKTFDDKATLDKAVNAALEKAQQAINSAAAPTADANAGQAPATTPTQDAASSAAASTAAAPLPAPRRLNGAALLLQIQLASQRQSLVLTGQAAAMATNQPDALPPEIILLLQSLQDIEYPQGELLHLAIQNKLIKGLQLCRTDKSNTLDTRITPLTADIMQALDERLKLLLPSTLGIANSNKICNEDFYTLLKGDYNRTLRPLIERLYSEPMPEYKDTLINWTGEGCGCVPKEIVTTAYGLYPYWNTTEDLQTFDFSTFSRVAYYGLSANDAGQLVQIKSNSQANTLVRDNSHGRKEFIEKARRYGSHVDWVIEKDWSHLTEQDFERDTEHIQHLFGNLHKELLVFISQEIMGPATRLRPLYTLGAANRPINGDGITLYFTHYPRSIVAKKLFDDFFSKLKKDLKKFDDERNRWRSIKQNTFLNLMTSQAEFTRRDGAFSHANINQLYEVSHYDRANLSVLEMQEAAGSLVILLLEDPYYTSLDEIYAITTSLSRNLIVPLMFNNYKNVSPISKTSTTNNPFAVDERVKKLAYVHESFGGGGFWPITSATDPAYKVFNEYISLNFAPGYTTSIWNDWLCAYRWLLTGITNLWLVLSFVYLLITFYLYPQQCRELPLLMRWLPHPATVLLILLPPLSLWIYLLLIDPYFKFLTLTSLLSLVVIGMAIWAGLKAVKALRQPIPNRNLLYYQKNANALVPTRNDASNDEDDDNDANPPHPTS